MKTKISQEVIENSGLLSQEDISDSTSSTSTTTVASSKAVKSAYDLANTAKTAAATAQSGSDNSVKLTGNQTIAGTKTFSSNIGGNITGNAASATKLATARNIKLTGDVTGSASFNGTADASISSTLSDSGVTAGSYGPTANSSPAHKGTFSVPQITVDAKGRVTGASTRTITLPADSNTTYSAMTGATSSAAGTAGLVPAPAAGKQASFLRGDGTWVVPTNTTYSNMTAATASAAGKAGLVPAPAAGKQASFLRGDGTWVVPTNTTYTAATATPKAAGTAAVGTSAKYAREDHVHPAQTTVSGNAGSATKLATARSLYVALGTAYNSESPVTFDGSAAKALPVSGTLPIARGGTGATSAANARTALGIVAASTSAAGLVQLNNTVTSTSTTQAATANAVKTAYDKANTAASSGISEYVAGANGYIKFGNGFGIVWGRATGSANYGSPGYNVTLPKAFANTNYDIVAAPVGTIARAAYHVHIGAITTTTFQAVTAYNGNGSSAVPFHYVAFGQLS